MRNKELENKNIAELGKLLAKARGELFKLKLEQAEGKLKNPLALRTKRRDIARIMTKINKGTK